MFTRTSGFYLFSHIFYGVTNALYFVYLLRTVLILRQIPAGAVGQVITGKNMRGHLRWLVPSLVSAALVLLYRTLYNLRYFLSLHWPPAFYSGETLLIMVAEAVDIIATIRFWHIMRDMVILVLANPEGREPSRVANPQLEMPLPTENPWKSP